MAAKPKPSAKRELATTTSTKVDDDLLKDILENDVGDGVDDMSQEDMAIPRIVILQALSPQCNKRDDAYVEGADPGMFMETVAHKLWAGETGITLIPVAYRKTHIEWKPRTEGGGFISDLGLDYDTKQCSRDEKGNYVNADGNHVVLTYEYLVLLIDGDGAVTSVLLSLTKTQLRKAKQLNTMLKTAQPIINGQRRSNMPIYFHKVQATTVPESNDQGNWFGWKFVLDGSVFDLDGGKDIYLGARDLREAWQAGSVRTSPPAADIPSDAEDDEAPM
jgi:hypothetical protein